MDFEYSRLASVPEGFRSIEFEMAKAGTDSVRRTLAYAKSDNGFVAFFQKIGDVLIKLTGGERSLDLGKGDKQGEALKELTGEFRGAYDKGIDLNDFMSIVKELFNAKSCIPARGQKLEDFYNAVEESCKTELKKINDEEISVNPIQRNRDISIINVDDNVDDNVPLFMSPTFREGQEEVGREMYRWFNDDQDLND